MFSFFGKKESEQRRVGLDSALKGVPAVQEHITVEENDEGQKVLLIPYKPYFTRIVRRFTNQGRAYARVELDELGTFVFDLIDGKRNVKKIIKLLQDKTRLHPREAEVSVTEFLKTLMRRNIILITLPD